MANLKRYHCDFKAANANSQYEIMVSCTDGGWVKFDDIKEYLPSTSTNMLRDVIDAYIKEFDNKVCNYSDKALAYGTGVFASKYATIFRRLLHP